MKQENVSSQENIGAVVTPWRVGRDTHGIRDEKETLFAMNSAFLKSAQLVVYSHDYHGCRPQPSSDDVWIMCAPRVMVFSCVCFQSL